MSSEVCLSSVYEDFCASRNWHPRKLISDGLRRLEERLCSGEPALLLLDLPTSYGKTTITQALARKAIEGSPFFSRLIHVLPMRSIADQLGEKVKKDLKEGNGINKKNYTEAEIERKIAIQHLGLNSSPYFAKKVVITTLDTFILNFYKAPVKEISRVFEGKGTHFDFPRAQIYSSLAIFDEFHLFSRMGTGKEDSKERSRSLTSVLCAVKSLCLAGVPVIVMTATMPKVMKSFLNEELGEYGITVLEEIYAKGDDPEYENERGSRHVDFSTVKREDLPGLCQRTLSEGKKVLCVFNTVKDAVKAFHELDRMDLKPFLIHGKLPEVVRKKRTEEISHGDSMKENTPKLAVSTQVIESGVDLSFDVLVTAPCPADRMMQRAGRVARDKHAYEGDVLIIENGGKDVSYGPYDPKLCDDTVKQVIEKNELTREIVDEVYRSEPIEKEKSLWKVLSWLDNFTLLDSSYVEKALEHYRGFTDNFGIVTGFMETKVESDEKSDYAVGLSEQEAKRLLMQRRKVVKGNEVIELAGLELRGLLNSPSLALELQLREFDGIALEDFDPEIGYVKLEG
ncbi:MAG: CRISPR-associated helicase Cas3' [Candidatus Verstraetearchaeota archaeon]|nr:CRISPR-associated helicase Cas3' [Candidatus Verstraetearchaeota archaeon]